MSDFPTGPAVRPFGVLGTLDAASSQAAEAVVLVSTGVGAAGTWPSANLAIYVPVLVEKQVTAYQMAIEVTTQAGNVDVGIYDELGTRLVSSGSTGVAAAGLQTFDITNTALSPGVYFLAMSCSSTSAAFNRVAPVALLTRACVVRQQASALALPTTATFANMAQAYIPYLSVSTVATI